MPWFSTVFYTAASLTYLSTFVDLIHPVPFGATGHEFFLVVSIERFVLHGRFTKPMPNHHFSTWLFYLDTTIIFIIYQRNTSCNSRAYCSEADIQYACNVFISIIGLPVLGGVFFSEKQCHSNHQYT